MRGRSSFISDMAQMANGAASALGGLREEIDNIVKQRTERSLNARGLVTREEFDALRTRHEAVAARLAALESQLAATTASSPAKAAARKQLPRKQLARGPRARPARNPPRGADSPIRLMAARRVLHATLSGRIIFAGEECR